MAFFSKAVIQLGPRLASPPHRHRLAAAAVGAGQPTDDSGRIQEAMDLSLEVHRLQKPRPDGTPYVGRPLEYGPVVSDTDLVVTAMLHDSVAVIELSERDSAFFVIEFAAIAGNGLSLDRLFGRVRREKLPLPDGPDVEALIFRLRSWSAGHAPLRHPTHMLSALERA